MKLPKSGRGHQYAVVFTDYLTKWPEVYPVRDQSVSTIAKLLVQGIVCRHGVPNQLLSDRGTNFLQTPCRSILIDGSTEVKHNSLSSTDWRNVLIVP